MWESRITIFDPWATVESAEIKSLIHSKTGIQACIVTGGDNCWETINQSGLILVLFSKCAERHLSNSYRNFLENCPPVPVIGLISRAPDEQLRQTIKNHMWHCITPPYSDDNLVIHIEKYLTKKPFARTRISQKDVKLLLGDNLLKGRSPEIELVKEHVSRVARHNITVLLNGETGTGKELAARMIHFLSPRAECRFVPVNCGAIPTELFENELFGHKKGAYTTANSSEEGLISYANGGTLFLDEIESMPAMAQAKLLRFLEEKKFKPLGQPEFVSADVRLIAAAKGELWSKLKCGQFREDLFYRLSVFQIDLPCLSDRLDDIPLLVEHFISRYALIYQKEVHGIEAASLIKLLHHDWPGNIRELDNVIHKAVVMAEGETIKPNEIELRTTKAASNSTDISSFKHAKDKTIMEFEQRYLINLLSQTHGNVTHAAQYAQKDRRAFCRLLKKHNINPAEFRL